MIGIAIETVRIRKRIRRHPRRILPLGPVKIRNRTVADFEAHIS